MAHDAVLVLDPSPGENFGHPVALFYVDVNVTKKRCSHMDGIYLGELQNSNECLCEVSGQKIYILAYYPYRINRKITGIGRACVLLAVFIRFVFLKQ